MLCAGWMKRQTRVLFSDTATTEIYTLSLHDALPSYDDPAGPARRVLRAVQRAHEARPRRPLPVGRGVAAEPVRPTRDRKSTRPELQSRQYLVCSLLLEKKYRTTREAWLLHGCWFPLC